MTDKLIDHLYQKMLFQFDRKIWAIVLLAFLVVSQVNAQKKATKATTAKTETKANTENTQIKEELAKVSILRYADNTASKNFGYMPNSLTEAIDNALQKRFLYNREDPQKSDKKAAEIRKLRKKFGAEEAAEYCKLTKSDILIFGSFSFDQASSELVIETSISLGAVDKFRTLQPVRNKVDNTIFQAVEIVADSIVSEMAKIAQEQQQRAGSDKPVAKEGEKVKIQKTDVTLHWADYKYMITATPAVNIPLLNGENIHLEPQPYISLSATRNFMSFLQFGLQSSVTSIRTKSDNLNSSITSQLSTTDVVLLGGYYRDFSPRWRLTSHLGAGYYSGSFEVYTDCQSGCSVAGLDTKKNVQNPIFLAKAGIHYLLFSYLAIGFSGEIRSYYDKPYPVHSFTAGLAITGVF